MTCTLPRSRTRRPGLVSVAALTISLALAGTLGIAGPASAETETTVDVTDFGADPSGATDSAPAVKAALQHAKTVDGPVRVLFPRGTYELYPEQAEQRELYMSNTVGADQAYRDKRIGILVEDMSDVTIDGDGSFLNYHGWQTAFAAIRSERVTFTDFAFDYETPKVVDATVAETGTADGRGYRVLDLPPDTRFRIEGTDLRWLGEQSPVTGEPYWGYLNAMSVTQIHDPETHATRRGSNPLFTGVAALTDLGDQRLRIDYTTATAPTDEGIVYQMRQGTRDTSAVFVWESEDVTLEGLSAHYLHGFGVLGQFSRNITLRGNDFIARPETERTTSAFADMVQMSGVAGKVTIADNLFDGAHDDPINIHGTYLEVTGRPDPSTITLAYRHPQTAGFPQFYPGNTLEFVRKSSMTPLPNSSATVVSVDGPSGRDHDKPLTTMTVRLDRPVPTEVTAGAFVAVNTTYVPDVEVSGNTFRDTPTRGLLVTTPGEVRIHDNVFDRITMASILITADASSWYESAPARDVRIERNTFLQPGQPAIQVGADIAAPDPENPVHRNIVVRNNEFRVGDVAVLDAKSTQGLEFSANRVLRADRDRAITVSADELCPAPGATLDVDVVGAAEHRRSSFVLRAASDVTLASNRFDRGINARVDLLNGTVAREVRTTRDIALGKDNIQPLVADPTLTSSDPTVVAVDDDGGVRAVAEGTATLTARVTTRVGDLVSPPRTITVGGDVDAPECYQPPRLSDDWSVVRDQPGDRAVLDDGALQLTPTGSAFLWATQNSARNLVLTDVGEGRGTATVKLTGRTQRGYAEAGLLLYGDDDNYVALQRKHNAGNPSLTVVSELGGSPEESRRVVDPTSQDVWLRLARTGDTVTASWSTDGTTFTPLGTPVPAGALGDARFGVLAEVESRNPLHTPFAFSAFTLDGEPVPFAD